MLQHPSLFLSAIAHIRFVPSLSSLSFATMDADLWAARLSAAKRFHSLQQAQHQWDVDDLEYEDETRPELACPYCYEDLDVSTLCSHMENEHSLDSKGVVCPFCAAKVPKDILGHMTVQHGNLFKIQRRRRFRRAGMPPGATRTLLGKEFREAHLHALLGGGAFRASGGSANNAMDSLLSALVNTFPSSESETLGKRSQDSNDSLAKASSLTERHNPRFMEGSVNDKRFPKDLAKQKEMKSVQQSQSQERRNEAERVEHIATQHGKNLGTIGGDKAPSIVVPSTFES